MPRHRTAVTATIGAPTGYVYALLAESRNAAGAWLSEPEPGRVLLERDRASARLTTFTVDKAPTGGSSVTIATDVTIRAGLRGTIARRLSTWRLRRAARRELAYLATVVTRPGGADGWSLPVPRRPARPAQRGGAGHPVQPV